MNISTLFNKDFSEYKAKSESSFVELTSKLINQNKLTVKSIENCPVVPSFYFYRCELKEGTQEIKSTGEAFNKKGAQYRSISELFERLPIFTEMTPCYSLLNDNSGNPKGSNGMAFNLTVQKALCSATLENIERHVVLNNWLEKEPVRLIKGINTYLLLSAVYGLQCNLKVRFYSIKNDFQSNVIVCHLNCDKPPYNIYGYASRLSSLEAIEKSFMEAWRFYWEYSCLDQANFNGEIKSFTDHFYYHALKKEESSFEVGSSIKISRLKTYDGTELFNQCILEDVKIYDLENYGYVGYSVYCRLKDTLLLKPGPIGVKTKKRLPGEVHPIA